MTKLMFFALFAAGAFLLPSASEIVANGIERDTPHYATNVLHKADIKETTNHFIINGRTDYTVVVDSSDASCGEAAAFLVRHLSAATGAVIPLRSDITTWDANAKYIVMGKTEMFNSAGLVMPSDDLGVNGYYIKNAGKSVFIEVERSAGWRYAVFCFLRATIGYDYITDDTVVYNLSGETLPDFNVIEKPDIDYNYEDNIITSTEVYGMGFLRQAQVFIGLNGKFVHNSLQYLPKSEYQADHPLWYSTDGGQLCYTAHGNKEEYELMVDTIFNVIKKKTTEYPTIDNITLTIEDIDTVCTCEACSANTARYQADSASIIMLCNDVSDKVDAYFEAKAQEEGTKAKEFNIVFFAYKKTEAAPVKEVNGHYEPIDEKVKCHKNVAVYIAPIAAKYESSFYESVNEDAYKTIVKWSSCTEKMYFWLYDTNYRNYLLPFNSFDSIGESYRLCKSVNAKFIVTEGQYNTSNSTAFNKFKIYLHSKYYFNVNSNYTDLVNSYFNGYYKDAAEPMKEFFYQMTGNCRTVEAMDPNMMNGNIYEQSENAKYYPKRLLENWLGLINKAYAKIEKYKLSDIALYNTLYDHICCESIFPRYALIQLHGSSLSSEELNNMKYAFKDDVTRLKIGRYSEGGTMSGLWTKWGI